MKFQLHVPQPPEQPPQPAVAPLVYVSEPIAWEYKQLVRDLKQEEIPDEDALNRLGAEGWELVTVVQHVDSVRYIFKRVAG